MKASKRPYIGDKRGEKNGNAKLTPEAVLSIRDAHARFIDCLAATHGITRSYLHKVLNKNAWKHLGEEAS